VRRAARVDKTQGVIVDALRKVGCKVQSLAPLGGGVADILVKRNKVIHLLEIKDGDKPPSRRRLTAAQKRWHADWGDCVKVVNNVDEALMAVIGQYTGGGGKVVR